MNELAIISVDDEKIILDSLKSQFEINFQDKFIFEFAESAEEALELIDELIDDGIKIILVISDYQMPGMKGDEFALILRNKLPTTKVILLTGQISQDVAIDFVNKNIFVNIVSKPWSENELVTLVKNIASNVG
ncbi:MAG: response regulator [Bacteroidota bacterium]|jgi:CheY-like chemotaxis protein